MARLMEILIILGLITIPAIVLKVIDSIAKIQDFDGLEYLDDEDN